MHNKTNLSHTTLIPIETEKTINIKIISKQTNKNINSNFIKKKKTKKKHTKNNKYIYNVSKDSLRLEGAPTSYNNITFTSCQWPHYAGLLSHL